MRRKKGFKKTTGHYFFNVSAGYQSNITISRTSRKEAVQAFEGYQTQRKECEWLGQWDGEQFVDVQVNAAA